LGQVSHLWFGFWVGKLPLKITIFSLCVKKNLFGSGQKVPGSKAGRPLIYCWSKVCSGQVRSGPISISDTLTAAKPPDFHLYFLLLPFLQSFSVFTLVFLFIFLLFPYVNLIFS